MPLPDEDVVRRVLSINDRDIRCREAVERAWESVKAKFPDVAWWRRKSTRAGVMWEESINNAVAAFEGDRGVQVVTHHDTASFIFDDLVLTRFKKASIQLHTSNYQTILAQLFHKHESDLFGFVGHHRVEIAHVLNRFGTGLEWIGIVAREGKRVLWNFELRSGGTAAVEKLPLRPRTDPAAERVLRPVKPDGDKTREKEIDKEGE